MITARDREKQALYYKANRERILAETKARYDAKKEGAI